MNNYTTLKVNSRVTIYKANFKGFHLSYSSYYINIKSKLDIASVAISYILLQ